MECKEDLLGTTKSPDGEWAAVEVFRDCEGATGPGSSVPGAEGNVFISRPAQNVDAKVTLAWRDSSHLDVTYKSGVRVLKRRSPVNGVEIRFIAQ